VEPEPAPPEPEPAPPEPEPAPPEPEPVTDSWRRAWNAELEAARLKRPPKKRRRIGALATGTAIASAAGVVAAASVLTHITPKTTQTANAAFHTRHHAISYMRIYRRVGREYGLEWSVLAAVGQIESRDGKSDLPGIHSGTNAYGAAGPAQFLKTTWARFGVDPHAKGRPNPYDPLDAITAMAAYLKASGAPEDWARALYTYNHSRTYVDEVLTLSRKLASQTAGTAGTGETA
jgi:hypothetical protein